MDNRVRKWGEVPKVECVLGEYQHDEEVEDVDINVDKKVNDNYDDNVELMASDMSDLELNF